MALCRTDARRADQKFAGLLSLVVELDKVINHCAKINGHSIGTKIFSADLTAFDTRCV